jgi:hypothetical protein
MVFARRLIRIHQASAEIDEASSVFSNFVAMAFSSDQCSQPVRRHRDPLLTYAAPNRDPARGRLRVPSARHLSGQH